MLRKLSKNTTWDDIRPSKYLKAEDLPEDGSILSVTVAGMSEQEMGKDKQVKWVMEFEELVKDLVFNNKVNFDMAKTVTGAKKPIDMLGKRIGLHQVTIDLSNGPTACIRVVPPESEREIDFGSEDDGEADAEARPKVRGERPF